MANESLDTPDSVPGVQFALTRSDLEVASAAVKAAVRTRRTTHAFSAAKYRLLTGSRLPESDAVKDWDAANVLELLKGRPRSINVIDCGAYNSAPLLSLAQLGFRHLWGIDLNVHLPAMPFSRRICYSVQNMEATAFDNEAFDVVLCSSAIEHGVDWARFLSEARRLLRPGGLLYLSTDIVNDDVEPSTVEAFGLPWLPLREAQLSTAVDQIAAAGFSAPAVPHVTLPDELPVSFFNQPLGFVAFTAIAA